jgi:hypothetical protein
MERDERYGKKKHCFLLFFLFLFIYFVYLKLFLWYVKWYLLLFYLLRHSTVEVTGPRDGGDVRGSPQTAIMVHMLAY